MSQPAADIGPNPQVRAGHEFPEYRLVIDSEYQHRLHGFCDIPRSLYGDRADPTFLARYPIKVIGSTMFACHPERGYVHMVHRIRQHKPAKLDTPVTVRGRFTEIEPVPRGWIMHASFDYFAEDGTHLMTVEPQALMADPTRMPDKSAKKPERSGGGAGEEGFEVLKHKQCTPEKVLGYCGDTNNKIHTDPEYAKGFGFRAPITAGNQIVNYQLEALATDGLPDSFDVSIRFLRPVFWDDAIDMMGRRGSDGRLSALRAVKEDGKISSTCEVFAVA